jgi:hypothetical protein
MTLKGQDDQFPPPRMSARSAFGKQTFAGTRGNEEDAPKAVARRKPANLSGSDPKAVV